MTLTEKINVMQAASRGEKIQRRNNEDNRAWRDSYGTPGFQDALDWTDVLFTEWNFSVFDYRIKPEPPRKPREFYVTPTGWECAFGGGFTKSDLARGRILVREVLE